jgi:hypothetical protein
MATVSLLQVACAATAREGLLPTEDLTPEADEETATLVWVMGALEHARSRGQTKVVGYLEEVADDVVFEVEAAARRREHA